MYNEGNQIHSLLQLMFQAQQVPITLQPDRWHPDRLGTSTGSYGPTCLSRISSDLRRLLADSRCRGLPGADVFPSEEDATRVEFLLRGQCETPYEGGFFHFSVRAPPEYPQLPPRVALRTTDNGRVRFNPNYYETGCVCLSILGTWPGEPWNPANTLTNVLHSLQYQFNQLPWDNEPGFDTKYPVEMKMLYNNFLTHETLRVAACDQLDPATSTLPPGMRRRAASHFVPEFQSYVDRCAALGKALDGKPMMNPYRPDLRNVPFNFAGIRNRLMGLRESAQRDAAEDVDDNVDDDPTVMEESENVAMG